MDPSERSVDELRKPTWIERISNRRHLNAAPAYAPNDGVLPSFFIVGPPRTGKSWLHEILRRHTVLPSPTKETRFFDSHFHRGIAWYRAHYQRKRTALPVGDIAPTYFRIERTAPAHCSDRPQGAYRLHLSRSVRARALALQG